MRTLYDLCRRRISLSCIVHTHTPRDIEIRAVAPGANGAMTSAMTQKTKSENLIHNPIYDFNLSGAAT